MSEPEHFADVVRRMFPTLEEIADDQRADDGDQPHPVTRQPLCRLCRARGRRAAGETA